MCLKDFSNERSLCLTHVFVHFIYYLFLIYCVFSFVFPCGALGFRYLHLSVSIFVGMTTALTLPAEFLELGLAALDRLRFRPPLTLVFL